MSLKKKRNFVDIQDSPITHEIRTCKSKGSQSNGEKQKLILYLVESGIEKEFYYSLYQNRKKQKFFCIERNNNQCESTITYMQKDGIYMVDLSQVCHNNKCLQSKKKPNKKFVVRFKKRTENDLSKEIEKHEDEPLKDLGEVIEEPLIDIKKLIDDDDDSDDDDNIFPSLYHPSLNIDDDQSIDVKGFYPDKCEVGCSLVKVTLYFLSNNVFDSLINKESSIKVYFGDLISPDIIKVQRVKKKLSKLDLKNIGLEIQFKGLLQVFCECPISYKKQRVQIKLCIGKIKGTCENKRFEYYLTSKEENIIPLEVVDIGDNIDQNQWDFLGKEHNTMSSYPTDDNNDTIFENEINNISMFRKFLSKKKEEIDINSVKKIITQVDICGFDLVCHFISRGYTKLTKDLASLKEVSIHFTDNFGNNYLHWSNFFGNEDLISFFKKLEVSQNKKNCFGLLPKDFKRRKLQSKPRKPVQKPISTKPVELMIKLKNEGIEYCKYCKDYHKKMDFFNLCSNEHCLKNYYSQLCCKEIIHLIHIEGSCDFNCPRCSCGIRKDVVRSIKHPDVMKEIMNLANIKRKNNNLLNRSIQNLLKRKISIDDTKITIQNTQVDKGELKEFGQCFEKLDLGVIMRYISSFLTIKENLTMSLVNKKWNSVVNTAFNWIELVESEIKRKWESDNTVKNRLIEIYKKMMESFGENVLMLKRIAFFNLSKYYLITEFSNIRSVYGKSDYSCTFSRVFIDGIDENVEINFHIKYGGKPKDSLGTIHKPEKSKVFFLFGNKSMSKKRKIQLSYKNIKLENCLNTSVIEGTIIFSFDSSALKKLMKMFDIISMTFKYGCLGYTEALLFSYEVNDFNQLIDIFSNKHIVSIREYV